MTSRGLARSPVPVCRNAPPRADGVQITAGSPRCRLQLALLEPPNGEPVGVLLAGKGLDAEQLLDKLNELGSEGWEVVAHVGYEVVDSIVLKRPRAASGKRRGPRDGSGSAG